VKIVQSDPITPEDFSQVVELIEKYKGIQYTFDKAKRFIENAKQELRIFNPSKEKEALTAMADYVLERRW
jgi:geranylgeranyl pyrophosphate synthase